MNILLLDGAAAFGPSQGRLNHTLQSCARDTLTALGHKVRETIMAEEYDPQVEVDNFLWMNTVIWQMPAWWMGEPWFVKAYIDKV